MPASSRRSTASPSATSVPPLASSWAEPPEFYIDHCLAGKTLRRSVEDLGYVVHTPPQVYGSREAADGTHDVTWLRDVGRHGWAVFGKDTSILRVPDELAAYKAAKIHMFLFPGQARREVLVELLHRNLRDICTTTSGRKPVVCRVTARGLLDM